MKTIMKTICFQTAAFVLCTLMLNGCFNAFLEKPEEGPGQETASPDIPEGFGAIRIEFSQGAARTLIPAADLSILHFTYWVTKDGGTAEEKTPADNVLTLEPGEYTLKVEAFVDTNKTRLAAEGETPFTITAGVSAETVNITLHPVVSGEGTGSLDFNLQYPTGVTVAALTLARIAGSENYNLMNPAPSVSGTNPLTLNGTKANIPVGYYLLRVLLKTSAEEYAGKTEVVHIYQNLTAVTALADYTFTAGNFRAFVVTNVNDSGPGSLRQVLQDVNAVPGSAAITIPVTLPPGSVIELESALPTITRNLTIEGNGVTLTPSASLTGSGIPRLLYIRNLDRSDLSIVTTIRRVHFKNGRNNYSGGAISADANLTLESCIFSGNRVTSSYSAGGGGAIANSNGSLTIRGCTFYGNSSAYLGGAIKFESSSTSFILTLTGNLFYGNTAGYYPIIQHVTIDDPSASIRTSYNVVDVDIGTGSAQCGWSGGTGNSKITTLPISPKTFKLLNGSPAKNKLPSALPGGYPSMDFYGQPISGGGAAGAVQASTQHGAGYYYLDLSINDSQRGSVTVNPADEDSLVSNGTTLTASSNPGYFFAYWLQDGVIITANPYILTTPSAHTQIQALFGRSVTIFSDETGSDTIPGTLRYALTNTRDIDAIRLSGVTAGTTVIELESALPELTKNITIEGNGVTLTRAASWTGSSDTSQLLRITGSTAEVKISGVYFKNGLATYSGGAIRNAGTLTLESCVFSGNSVTAANAYGGAVYSSNTLTVRGCTFYGNSSGYRSGVVCFDASGKTLTLTGNIFYGNSAASGYPAAYNHNNSGNVSASYNVVDMAFGTGSYNCGWDAGTGDTQITGLPVSPVSFNILYDSGAANKLPASLPADYPTTDFYGQPINGGGAAGAVQAFTANQSGYSWLELLVNDSLRGNVSASPALDEDGLVPNGSVTITAAPNPGPYSFVYWLQDGVKMGTTNSLTINLTTHSSVQAVFSRTVIVNDLTDGAGSAAAPGTLRYALTNAQDFDVISLSGVTAGTTVIELESTLPELTKNITIEGNGVTLTRAASWTGSSDTSQLLRITGSTAEVKISGVYFRNGLVTNYGGAVNNTGILTLESCIFSGNRATASDAYGGAVYSSNTLTIRGCTFYGNTSGFSGGALYFYASGKTLTLTGNLFYGNTGGSYPVVRNYSGTVSPLYNVVDAASGDCGWTYDATDVQVATLPLSPITFKVLYGSAAAAKLPGTLPADYPATDFYGQPINGSGAAGAVQALTPTGYSYLGLSVNDSQRGSISANSAPDGDGLYPNGSSIIITAAPNPGPYSFAYWLRDGVKTGTTNPLTITLTTHSSVQAVFFRAITVNDLTDGAGSAATPGTLRYALTNAQDFDVISLSGVTAGTTVIELESTLPELTKSITIEGNGVTLTRAASWTGSSDTSQLFRIIGSTVEVRISGVHFKNGLARAYGGAIDNSGTLTLESCTFSGNRTTGTYAYGGAVYSSNTLTVRGCTFYNNSSNYQGGAVYFNASGETLTLMGNLFYGNTASSYPVVRINGGSVSASYNVVDADFGTGSAQCGWDAGTGNLYSSAPLVSPRTFKVLYGSAAAAKLPATLPADYPAVDFYGQTINGSGAAGAVQALTPTGYSYLELSVNDSQRGSVTASPAPDEDGLVPNGSIIITATQNPAEAYSFGYWLVDGVNSGSANPHTLTINTHTLVQAVFNHITVNDFTDGASSNTTPGTLRYALTNVLDGDVIRLSGVTPGTTTIELESALPVISKDITIEGNGVTLTRAASWTDSYNTTQLLSILGSTAEVKISGVHFKNGLATNFGGAIRNLGILTLESCIFSGNRNTGSYGGAVYSGNALTVRGCTFYNNSANSRGGAVYFDASGKTLTLTGNLFYGNTASGYPVVYNNGGTINTSYNVVDAALGTGSTDCGWTAGTGDTTFSALGIAGDPFNTTTFVPVSGLQNVLPTAPTDFPATDFYGAARTFPGAPGAVGN